MGNNHPRQLRNTSRWLSRSGMHRPGETCILRLPAEAGNNHDGHGSKTELSLHVGSSVLQRSAYKRLSLRGLSPVTIVDPRATRIVSRCPSQHPRSGPVFSAVLRGLTETLSTSPCSTVPLTPTRKGKSRRKRVASRSAATLCSSGPSALSFARRRASTEG